MMKHGLYCNVMVKTAHKGFPRELLSQTDLFKGEWAAYAADVEGVRVQVNNCKTVLQIHLSQRHSKIFPCKTLSMLLYRNKFHESKIFIFLFCCYLGCQFPIPEKKEFISTCSTALPGKPHKTKHQGFVQRPQVAEAYLKSPASIDVHNHVRTGSLGLEDVWQTKDPHKHQFTGITGFIFTNSYLAYRFFTKNMMEHRQLKKTQQMQWSFLR